MSVIAIIPARSGSKGVPGKNLRRIGGRSLLARAVTSASRAVCEVFIYVTSDSDEVLASIGEFGFVSPIKRPPELSGDGASMIETVSHALTKIRHGPDDVIVLLQPTTPLRTGADIDGTVQAMRDAGATSALSVVRVEDGHPAHMYRRESGGLMRSYMTGYDGVRRQDLPEIFLRNGAVYCFVPALVDAGKLVGERPAYYEMPIERSANIDTELDLKWAEFLYEDSERRE